MKKNKYNYLANVLTIIVSLIFSINSFSQSFSFDSGKTYTVNLPNDEIAYFDGIYFTNISGTILNLTWELALKDTLDDCEFYVCNNGECLGRLPSTGTMAPIAAGEKGFLKLHMFTGATNGTNKIKYVLKNGATQIDTMLFIINVGTPTGMNQIQETKHQVSLFPNPCSNQTTISFSSTQQTQGTVYLTNEIGQVVMKETEEFKKGNNQININTQAFKTGHYMATILIDNEKINKPLVIIKE